MDEENNFTKETVINEAKNLKEETKETVNQVKDSFKSTMKDGDSFKADTRETTNFLKGMFAFPFDEVKRAASETENFLSKDIILVLIFVVSSVLYRIIALIRYSNGIGDSLLKLIMSVINPLMIILVQATVIYVANKNNRKNLVTTISAVTIASVPTIIAEIVSIIAIIIPKLSVITSPVNTALKLISYIFLYVATRELFNEEEDNTFIKKFAVIELIALFIINLISSIG